jgi:lipopolysaccharide export system permease protein
MSLALAAVLGGPFSRLGYARRIGAVAVLATVVRILGFVVQAASDLTVWINILQYAIPIALTCWALDQLFDWRTQLGWGPRSAPAPHIQGALA